VSAAIATSACPDGRGGEVVDAILHLERATFVTGEILHVGGGAHAGRR
jgi:hypothetical protein